MLRIFVGVLLSLVLLVMLGTATFAAPPNDASRPQPPSQLGASTAPCPCEYTLFWDTALAQIMTPPAAPAPCSTPAPGPCPCECTLFWDMALAQIMTPPAAPAPCSTPAPGPCPCECTLFWDIALAQIMTPPTAPAPFWDTALAQIMTR
jgi:hypothetical protein